MIDCLMSARFPSSSSKLAVVSFKALLIRSISAWTPIKKNHIEYYRYLFIYFIAGTVLPMSSSFEIDALLRMSLTSCSFVSMSSKERV